MDVYLKRGNSMFVHASASFTDKEIEDHFNHEASPHKLDSGMWKMCPVTLRNPKNRIECPSDSQYVHVCLTHNGEPFDPGPDGAGAELVRGGDDEYVEELMIMIALRNQAARERVPVNSLLKRIVKDYLTSKGEPL